MIALNQIQQTKEGGRAMITACQKSDVCDGDHALGYLDLIRLVPDTQIGWNVAAQYQEGDCT